jgi:hypothetical protein
MKSVSGGLFVAIVALVAAGCGKTQENAAPAQPQAQAQAEAPRGNQMQGAADWRQRMQANHNADSSVEQQVRRLTTNLELTPAQQSKVRQLSRWHNDRIQTILDTSPPALTYQDFQTQVHAISAQYHDSVNAILTPHQLDLMKTMTGRMGGGGPAREVP